MTPRKRHWLMKSEPNDFSIDDLQRVDVEPWTGVRNYQARNFMRNGMSIGDAVLFYHSNVPEPGVFGIAEIASAAYPDPTQFRPKSHYYDPKSTLAEPRWFLVDVKFKRKLKRPILLSTIRAHGEELGEDFELVRRGTRLSVFPVSALQFKTLLTLEPADE